MTIEVSRRELHEELGRATLGEVAAKYGISESWLEKLCRRHHVPIPPTSWWKKVRAGLAPSRKRLPRVQAELEKVVLYRPESHGPVMRPTPEALRDPLVLREADSHWRIRVPEDGEITHPLLMNGGLGALVSVRASETARARARRILQALLFACEPRGFSVGADEEGIFIGIRERVFHVILHERGTRPAGTDLAGGKNARERTPWGMVPTGRLCLQVREIWRAEDTFTDSPKRRLEDLLNQFFLRLVRETLEKRVVEAAGIVGEAMRRKREDQQRRHQEEQRREWENRDREQWLRWAEEWQRAEGLRGLANAIRASAGVVPADSELGRRLQWLEDRAAQADPLPRLLGEISGAKGHFSL